MDCKKNLHKDARSRNRQEWINSLRASISQFISNVEFINFARVNETAAAIRNYEKELILQKNIISFQLNLNDELHVNLISKINNATNNTIVLKGEYKNESDIKEISESARHMADSTVKCNVL